MKNKKGLTLVELLAVIVVLAVLALITIPIISNVINDVRIKSLQNSAYGLIEASNLYYVSKGNNTTIRFDKNDTKDTLKELSYKGVVKIGTVIIDKKGKVTVCITDGKNSAYKNYNESKVTTKKGKCEIFEGSSIVYLDNEATISELSLAELTEKVLNLENSTLKIDDVYPVGSIYISMTENTASKVEEKFGGTWEALDNGYMLQNTTTTSNQKGGSSTATFTPSGTVGDHRLLVSEMPSHSHAIWSSADVGGDYYGYQNIYAMNGGMWSAQVSDPTGGDQPHTHTFTGTSQTINTVPPYITVYMYKRTA